MLNIQYDAFMVLELFQSIFKKYIMYHNRTDFTVQAIGNLILVKCLSLV